MKIFKDGIVSLLVIFLVISIAFAVANAENNNLAEENNLFVRNEQGITINQETVKNSVDLYKKLSDDKKTVIKERMAALSQTRQKNIDRVEKQIKEYKLQKHLQKARNQITQINQLQAIQKIALKENATETAKSLEILISWYQNKKKLKSLEDRNLNIE